MHFSDELIGLARELRRVGVPWIPEPGHYVLDESKIVQRESPFQEDVYFVLNLPHFTKLCGSEERFKSKMLWLPTWDQARQVLRQHGVSDEEQQAHLITTDAIARQRELPELYEMILKRFAGVTA